MATNCLETLIGTDLGCTTTSGRLYLGDVGITRKELDSYTSEEDATVADFLDKRRRAVLARMATDFTRHHAPRMIARSYLDRARVGQIPDTPEAITADANSQGGIVLELDRMSSNLAIHITRLELFASEAYAGTGMETVTFTDLDTGETLATATAEAVAGVLKSTEVDISIPNNRRRVRLLAWHSVVEFNRMALQASEGCGTCSPEPMGILQAYGARILKASPKTRANLDRQTHTSGLAITVSVGCDHAATLCQMKAGMAWPALHALASEILGAGIANAERLNTRTLDKEELERRRAEHEAKYQDAFTGILAAMPLPSADPCWACDRKVATVVAIP